MMHCVDEPRNAWDTVFRSNGTTEGRKMKTTEFVLKVNGLFFCHSGKMSAEYPEARKFNSYVAALDAVELYDLIANGASVELFSNYGRDDEIVEDI